MLLAAALAGGGAACSGGPPALAPARTTVPPTAATVPRPPAPPPSPAPVDPVLLDLMDGAGMTPVGRALFLSAAPRVEEAAALQASCGRFPGADKGAYHVIGCFTGGRIHLRRPAAPELSDFVYVAAAHELLHVVFAAAGAADRARLVEEVRAARAAAGGLELQLRGYPEAHADDEAHALVGTQVAILGPALEAHYGRYFDRRRVLDAYGRTMAPWDAELAAMQKAHDQSAARLDVLKAEIEALRAVGDDRAPAVVDHHNALVREHNGLVAAITAKNDELNRLLGG